MIAQVWVDGRTLAEPIDANYRFEAHRRIARDFLKFGALRFLEPKDMADLKEHIRRSDPQIREMWTILLKRLDECNRVLVDWTQSVPMRESLEQGALPANISDLVDLLLASESTPVSTTGDERVPELTTSRRFDLSRTMTRLRDFDDEPTYAKETSREVIWQERWKPLAKLSRSVWICDPYLFGRAAIGPEDGWRIAHVNWLLDRLNEVMPRADDVQVHLFAAKGAYDMKQVEEHLRRSAYCRTRPGSLSIFVAEWRLPDDGFWGPHDRHIRFSCGAAVDVDSGFDPLRRRAIRDLQGYKCHFIGPGKSLSVLTQVEESVAANAQRWVYGEDGLVQDGQ